MKCLMTIRRSTFTAKLKPVISSKIRRQKFSNYGRRAVCVEATRAVREGGVGEGVRGKGVREEGGEEGGKAVVGRGVGNEEGGGGGGVEGWGGRWSGGEGRLW